MGILHSGIGNYTHRGHHLSRASVQVKKPHIGQIEAFGRVSELGGGQTAVAHDGEI